VPIPKPGHADDLAKPVIYWTPVIAPGRLTFYKGDVPAVAGLRTGSAAWRR
jgi:glucose/arabinose dehydrogenase